MVTDPPANVGDVRDVGSIPGSPGGGHGNPPQYSCLESPMGRGARRAMVRGVAELDMTEQLTLWPSSPEYLLTELLNAGVLAHEGVIIRSLRFGIFFRVLSLQRSGCV